MQRDLCLTNNPSAVQESPSRSNLQLAVRSPAAVKLLKSTRPGEWPQLTNGEKECLGLFVPLGKLCARNRLDRMDSELWGVYAMLGLFKCSVFSIFHPMLCNSVAK